MKQVLKAFASFHRRERVGITVLLCIIIALVVVKATMHLWVKPEYDKAQEAALLKSWEAFKTTATLPAGDAPIKKDSTNFTQKRNRDIKTEVPGVRHQESKPAQLFEFDPNTVDSPTLRKLGLREKTTAIFLHWRAKGKKFYRKEEFKKVYTLTPEEYERLAPYIVIDKDRLR